jgi:hypothetical protein
MGAQIATSKLILAAVHQSSTDTAAAAAHIGYVPHRARWHLHRRTVVLGTTHAPRPCKYGSISGSGRFGAAMVGSVLILLHHDQLIEQRGQLDGYLYLTSERSQVPTGRRIYKQIDNLDTKTPKNSRERAERAAPNGALWWRACGAQAHETWWHGRRKPDTWPAVETSCLIPSQFTLIPSQCVKKL